MDKKEVITLSSDDECDFVQGLERKSQSRVGSRDSSEILKKSLERFKNLRVNNDVTVHSFGSVDIVKIPKVPKRKPKSCPEVVDLEDYTEKPDKEEQVSFVNNKTVEQNYYSQEIIDVDEVHNEKNKAEYNTVECSTDTPGCKTEVKEEKLAQDAFNNCQKDPEILGLPSETTQEENSDQSLKFFTEFVEYCGCLEEIPNDRVKLTKKLMKKYGEANCHYIKSQRFRELIQKCRLKLNKNNLYLIAKEVTDELKYRKEPDTETGKTNISDEECQNQPPPAVENNEQIIIIKTKEGQSKKRTKLINKIIKKLDKLGSKIRELEEKEVDLSDEEESTYVQLQRYRERFCQIYTKLCKYTKEVADAERICKRKICFNESKYPAINKYIENWLNKTKRFPDFSDVMKLLESQSSSLGLPTNKESIRGIAIEIFQKVGVMLQRRRKYDLWDSFCGYLDDGEDPADKDPLLDQLLKSNYETRVKKEQEIFQHYVDLQERDRLEPEEVPDEEANHSPVESGNEEEKEIELIENSMNERLDDEIKKDTEENGDIGNDFGEKNQNGDKISVKESKNNFKNCKSLKWRLENGKRESENSEKEQEGGNEKMEKEFRNTERSVLPGEIQRKNFDSPSKRKWLTEKEEIIPKKKKFQTSENPEDSEIFEIDENPRGKTNEVFEVRCCQIITDRVFDDFESEKKKDWGKRKVFRDLTNVNRLMELNGRKRKMSGLFSPSFFYRSFTEFGKSSWKKRFKVSFRYVGSKGQKYALNQEDKSGKRVNSDSGGDSEKDVQNNSEGGDDEGENFFSGQGNGSEEDNNGDENKKNGKTDGEISENQHEEDEDEEEEEENETEEDDNKTETSEHSCHIEKTEEPKCTNDDGVDEGVESTTTTERINESEGKDEIEETAKDPEQESDSHSEVSESKTTEKCSEEEEEEEEQCVEKGESGNDLDNEEKHNTELKLLNCLTVEIKEGTIDNEESKDKTSEISVETIKLKDSKPETTEEKITCENKPKIMTAEPSNRKTNPEKMKDFRYPKLKSHPTTTEKTKREWRKRGPFDAKPTPIRNFLPSDSPGQKPQRKNTPSTSDEEIVKRFLLHSPSSISITPPKKLTLTKPPSQAAIQALATLRNLKGISTTIVKGGRKPKTEEDVVVIGGSYQRPAEKKTANPHKRKRTDLPVISNVQSIDSTTPKIVTVQGNVSGFENPWPEVSNSLNSQCNSNSIRISNVWGNLPNNFMQCMSNECVVPGCSFQENNPTRSNSNPVKKKPGKKTVEYVVLD